LNMEQNVANEELFIKVVSALDELRPFLHEDGGDLEIVDITPDKTLKIQFVGACGSCSMNNMTFKNGVEDAIKRLVPEIKQVEPVNFTLNK
jgi:Fe-S cluster biogenesis protein NfuA